MKEKTILKNIERLENELDNCKTEAKKAEVEAAILHQKKMLNKIVN